MLTLSHAEDMRKVPPMTYEGSADVELKGRELEAIEVTLRQFHKAQFSTSGDLRHFTTELRRRGGNLAVSFFPEYDEASSHALQQGISTDVHHIFCVTGNPEDCRVHIRA
jgi:hypothetical protein